MSRGAVFLLMSIVVVASSRTASADSPVRGFAAVGVAATGGGAAEVTDLIRRLGSLQFLSATIVASRREVVALSQGIETTEVTPSLRIFPTFSGRTLGVAALATF